jgi:hypothetical protein
LNTTTSTTTTSSVDIAHLKTPIPDNNQHEATTPSTIRTTMDSRSQHEDLLGMSFSFSS